MYRRSNGSNIAWIVLLAALIGACGAPPGEVVVDQPPGGSQGEPSIPAAEPKLDALALGACTDPASDRAERDRAVSPSHLWRYITQWSQVTSTLTLGQPAADPSDEEPSPMARLDPVAPETSTAAVDGSLLLSQADADRVLEAQDGEGDLYAGVVDDGDGAHGVLMAVVAGDEVAFVGECRYDPHTKAIERFAASRDETAAATFLALTRGTIELDAYEAWGPGPEETWDAASLEHLESLPLLDASGALHPELVSVTGPIVDYAWGPFDTLDDLVDIADAVVVARTGERTQAFLEHSGSRSWRVQTRQTFEIVDVIVDEVRGEDIEDTVEVIFMGGAVGDQLIESQGEPQYRADREYLLFLHATPDGVDGYWTVGPAAGRYLIDDGTVVAPFVEDLQGDHRVAPSDETFFATMVGRDLDDLADDILAGLD